MIVISRATATAYLKDNLRRSPIAKYIGALVKRLRQCFNE